MCDSNFFLLQVCSVKLAINVLDICKTYQQLTLSPPKKIFFCKILKQQMVPCKSTAEEVSFEWSHHRI